MPELPPAAQKKNKKRGLKKIAFNRKLVLNRIRSIEEGGVLITVFLCPLYVEGNACRKLFFEIGKGAAYAQPGKMSMLAL
jgi:hypothetical protein